MDKYTKLLKSWCDRLIDLQITERADHAFYGGILCPACVSIHGRIGDAVYPFTLLYDLTREEKYLDAAKRVILWSKRNVIRQSGVVFNEKKQDWRGISVFSAIALGDTLHYHGSCLDKETKADWTALFRRIVDAITQYWPDSESDASSFPAP